MQSISNDHLLVYFVNIFSIGFYILGLFKPFISMGDLLQVSIIQNAILAIFMVILIVFEVFSLFFFNDYVFFQKIIIISDEKEIEQYGFRNNMVTKINSAKITMVASIIISILVLILFAVIMYLNFNQIPQESTINMDNILSFLRFDDGFLFYILALCLNIFHYYLLNFILFRIEFESYQSKRDKKTEQNEKNPEKNPV